MPVQTHIRYLAKKIIAGSTQSRSSSAMLFRLTEWIARRAGIDALLINRAEHIFKKRNSPANALRLLSCCIRPKLGMEIPGFTYNIADQLDGDDEKTRMLELLKPALAKSKSGPAREALQIQIFRLEGKGSDDRQVRDFIRDFIQTGIEKKTGSRKSPGSSKSLQSSGLKALLSIRDIFEKHDKRFFLISGTLLGAVRENGFIGKDLDIDLGVLEEETSLQDIRMMMRDSRFFLREDFEYKLGYQSHDGVDLEFFTLHRTQDDKFLIRGFSGIVEWHFSSFEPATHEFQGHKFLIPGETDRYLAENYGNWHKKPLFYHYIFDTPVHQIGNNRDAMIYLSIALAEALRNEDRFLAENIAWLLKDRFGIDYSHRFPDMVRKPAKHLPSPEDTAPSE